MFDKKFFHHLRETLSLIIVYSHNYHKKTNLLYNSKNNFCKQIFCSAHCKNGFETFGYRRQTLYKKFLTEDE